MRNTLGMEFQTVGGKENVRKKNSQRYIKPSHGEKIVNREWGTMETDGTDLEFVTKSVEFDQNGNNIYAVVNSAKEEFKNQIRFDSKRLIHFKGNTWYKTIDNDAFIVNPDGNQKAHPQATIGIERIKIPDLIEGTANLPLSHNESNLPLYDTTHGLIKLRNQGTKKVTANTQQLALRESILTTKAAKKPDKSDFSTHQKAFLAVIKEYIDMHQFHKDKNEDFLINAKSQMPLMLRTSLMDLFQQLDDTEKEEVVNYLKDNYDFATTVITGEDEHYKITLQQWFDGIGYKAVNLNSIQRDLLNVTFHSVSEISAINVTINPLTSVEKTKMMENLNTIWKQKVRDLDRTLQFDDILKINDLIISFNTTNIDDIADKEIPDTISLLSRWIIATEAKIRKISTHEAKFGEPFDQEKALLELRSMQRNVPLDEWPNVARSLGKFVYPFKK